MHIYKYIYITYVCVVYMCVCVCVYGWCFPGDANGKESVCITGDPSSIPGLGRSPEVGNGNPFHYSCLKNSMDRGAWQAPVHGVAESQTWLSNPYVYINTLIYFCIYIYYLERYKIYIKFHPYFNINVH